MEQDYSLKEILVLILRKRRIIWACALACALLLGGWKVYGGVKQLADPGQPQMAEGETDDAMAAYELDKQALTDEISLQTRQYADVVRYNADSPLMRVDPYNKEVFRLSFAVSVDRAALLAASAGAEDGAVLTDRLSDLQDRVLGRYFALAESLPIAEAASRANAGELQEASLKELVQITWAGGVITIEITSAPGLDAAALADGVYAYLEEQQPAVARQTAAHELQVVARGPAVLVDTTLAYWQQSQAELPAILSERIADKEASLADLAAPGVYAPAPEGGVAAAGFKFALLGLLAGAVLGMVLAFLSGSLPGRLHTIGQLREGLKLRYLGGMQRQRKRRGWLDKAADRLDDRANLLPKEERDALLRANLREAAGDGRNFLLISTLGEDVVSACAEELNALVSDAGMRVFAGGDVNLSAAAVEKLRDADGVILAERCEQSSCERIISQVNRLRELDAKTVGFVLV